ncbi:DUF1206 domain-containing protein [Herbidospora sp. NBRC 101105]|uniref:DUF1206 domain-containing protein n=1 Tax=Herbidospora sp. NBRC 101105 TaxID=3032195 RepID=UPI0024A32D20|nr:DUF1206 domain-containing protein [Herbidospora sp. NBRC 101105]GLX97773.1 membrane protein [Herbidospora sp. NBRC 101105]
MTTTETVGGAARRAVQHPLLDKLAKVGFAARGVLYALIGLVALQIAFGGSSGEEADKSGAIHMVAEQPFGSVLLWVMAVGLAGLAVWQIGEAIWGNPKMRQRVESIARAVVYVTLVISITSLLLKGKEASSTDSQSQDATRALFELPGGQFLVGLFALGLMALGVYWIHEGWTEKFMRDMHVTEPKARTTVVRLGKAGYIARGIVAIAAGVLVGQAALTYDPDRAAGIDDALKSLSETPMGPWLLAAVAIGLILFAAYCFAESRWHRT